MNIPTAILLVSFGLHPAAPKIPVSAFPDDPQKLSTFEHARKNKGGEWFVRFSDPFWDTLLYPIPITKDTVRAYTDFPRDRASLTPLLLRIKKAGLKEMARNDIEGIKQFPGGLSVATGNPLPAGMAWRRYNLIISGCEVEFLFSTERGKLDTAMYHAFLWCSDKNANIQPAYSALMIILGVR